MPFTLVRQDITRMKTDAIVNAANTQLLMGGGVCGAIFRAAGPEQMQEACSRLSPIRTGEAVITPGFNLPAKYVIHTAGPVYDRQNPQKCERLLRSSYTASLQLASQYHCESIAFPLISSGIYGYPKNKALQTAISAIRDYLSEHDMDVYLAVFDRDACSISEELLGGMEAFIDQNYVDAHTYKRRLPEEAAQGAVMQMPDAAASASRQPQELDDFVRHLDEPFNETLMRLIDARGMKDPEVYRKANIDRKLFSKIRTGKGYTPGKKTILALCIALELNMEETEDLLEKAGYALSGSRLGDVIVTYFIENGEYDIYEINEALFRYSQPLLGAG